MAAIFQIQRGTTDITIHDGELYVHKGKGSLQFGSGSNNAITLLPLNVPVTGDINLSGSISASGDVRIGGNIYLGDNLANDSVNVNSPFSGSIIPSGSNVFDLGSNTYKYRNVYATSISGAIAATNGVISGSSQLGTIFEAVASSTHTIVSGSSQITSILTSLNSFSSSILTETASLETRAATLGTYTASVETRFSTLATLTGSNSIRLNNLESKSSSVDTQLTTLSNVTSSLETRMTTLANVTSSIHSYTSSLKTAIGVSGTDVTVLGNLTVNGTTTQINSTQVNIGENILELNFGGSQTTSGIYAKDATGASTISGSLLWDSTLDYWKAGKLANESKILLAGGDGVISSSMQLTNLNSFTASVTSSLVSIYQTTASLNLFSASVTSSLVSIYQTTSSLNTWSGSAKIELSNLELKSASVDISIANINTTTASLETRTSTLTGVTSSILNWTSSAKIELTNLELFSGSQLTQNNTLVTLTSSYTTRFDTLQQVTSSLMAATSSLFISASRMTSSILVHEGRITYLEGIAFGGIDLSAQFAAIQQVTSSLNTFTSSANIRLNNIEAATSSYETKGRGIVSGSSQIIPLLPNGVISGSSQLSSVFEPIASSTRTLVSGSAQILGATNIHSGSYTGNNNIVSGAAQIPALLPSGAISGSSQILGGTGIHSGSYTGNNSIVSSSSQIVYANISSIPANIVSGSSQLAAAFEAVASSTHTLLSGSSQILGGSGIHSGSYTGNNSIVSGSSQLASAFEAIASSTHTLLSGSGQFGNYVATIAGTTNQITVAGSGLNNASITLSTPQNIHSAATPTFAGLTINGAITATGDITAYYSDKRLKDISGNIDSALEKVNQISGVYYKQNELAETFGYNNYNQQVGVIAQEIQSVLPEAIALAPFDRDENGNSKSGENYLTVHYEKIIPLLIESIKELSNKVKELENK